MAGLDRQASVSSASSGGSGMSAASSMAAGGDGMGGAGDITESNEAIQKALFGFLLTLYKERWEDSKRFMLGRVVLEHLQLLLILLQAQFWWSFNTSFWLWDILNYTLLRNLTLPGGYTAYTAMVYLMVAVAAGTLLGCGWVSYRFSKNGTVPNKWPVKLLRLVMVLFYKVFYLTVINYLLGPVNCSWLATSNVHYSVDFPTKNCMTMPHLAVIIISGIGALLVIAVSGLMSLAEVTPNPVSQNWLAAAHSEVEMKSWLFRTAIVVAANVLTGFGQVQAIIILLAAGWLVYVHVRYQPYLFAWVNHIRTGLYGMAANTALLLAINLYADAELQASSKHVSLQHILEARAARSEQLTLYALVLLPAALVAGMLLSWLRLRLWVHPVLNRFRAYHLLPDESLSPKDIHKFVDAYEVELAARCCRCWDEYEDNVLNPDGIELAELIIKAGLARFPTSAHMVLVYINFLANVQKNMQACNSQLQAARKLDANWCDRYVFFVREQQQLALLQAHAGQDMDGSVDLVGYVEFQRNFKQVLRAHKAALYSQRAFWKQLLHSSVPFSGITRAFSRIEATRSTADRAYKTMLERYPSNIKVLRAYARFLEGVMNDPWSASKFFSEADRLEEMEGAEAGGVDMAGMGGGGGGGADAGGGMAAGMDGGKNSAVCVINAQGIIQMVNKPLLKLFGYKKGEIEGKNVSLLMPQPFSNRHNGFLRNYITTGKAKILNTVREVVALHRDHYVFPLTIAVTKVSGSGADGIFMGVLKPLQDEADLVRAWIMPAGGLMLCVDMRFADWFGLTPADCLGKPFSSLSADPDVLQGLLEAAASASPDDLDAGLIAAKDVLMSHKYAGPMRCDISIKMGGTDAERLYVAVIRKRATADASEHLMVTDKKQHIVYITTKFANLLGFPHPKSLIKTEFTRFMAQPFMQLHSKWMRDIPTKAPPASCRNGTPVVLITHQRTPVPAKLEISTKEVGEDHMYIVKVNPVTFNTALLDRRVSLKIDAHGDILEVGNSPAQLFGFNPQLLAGRNLSHCLDIFTGLPTTGGAQGLDMEHVLVELVHKAVEQKDSSWRCGVHPPLTPEEWAAAKANVVQANMLANQTKAALLQLEVEMLDDDEHGIASITAHLWRSEMLTGVLEVDKQQMITKAGCCALHQPGPIFGLPSGALLHTTLSHWLSVPPTYDGLLLETKKKGGALKKKAADIKIGPLLHATGQHFDGDRVKVGVQAVVKEGTGGSALLVVKLTVEQPSKGNPNFARRLLGLPDLTPAPNRPGALSVMGGLVSSAGDQGAAGGDRPADGSQGGREDSEGGEGDDGGGGGAGRKSVRAKGGVRFGGGGGGDAQEEEGQEDGGGGSEEDIPLRSKSGKDARLMDWVRQASGFASEAAATTAAGEGGGPDDDAPLDAEESHATTAFMGMPMPPTELAGDSGFGGYAAPPDATGVGDDTGSKASGADDEGSQVSGSEAGGYQSDFKRGRRLRKLARMLNSKPAQKFTMRFYTHTVAVIALLVAAHLACFAASVVLLEAQKQYIDEVDDAGISCIAMHRMAIDCRVLDGLSHGMSQPGIFVSSDYDHFIELFDDAITSFETAHEATYMGRNNVMRRFFNRAKYKLHDYWEEPMWPATIKLDTTPPLYETRNMSLWQLGNTAISSAREVLHNNKRMIQGGKDLSDHPFWRFVIDNAPNSLYNGYKVTLYGLVERALSKIEEVRTVMVILLVLEGCGLFLAATVYVCLLVRKMVSQRADLFSVFLVIPTGFLRALASKQVQLDEDDDSDNDSDIGEMGEGGGGGAPPQQQQQEQQETKKLNLSLGGAKRASLAGGAGGGKGGKQKPQTLFGRLSAALNPAKWLAPKQGAIDTGKRQLQRNSRDILIIGCCFVLWGAIVIVVYGSSMQQLQQVHGPFQMLNVINFIVFRITRAVLYSLEAVMAAPDTTAIRDMWQPLTAERLRNLNEEYTTFLYGFDAVGGGAVASDLATNQAGLFQTAELGRVFFRTTDCLRKDKSSCFPEGHKFYAATHSGLDAIMTRFLQEGALLVRDNPADVNITNTRFQYMWQIGRADLIDGVEAADAVFRGTVEGMFDQMRIAHISVFVISLVWALVLWLGIVRPMLRRSGKESRQIAEMLSQLPAEMDVEGLVGQAIVKTGDDDEAAAGSKPTGISPGKRLSGAGNSSGKGMSQAGRRSGSGKQQRDDDMQSSDAGTDG